MQKKPKNNNGSIKDIENKKKTRSTKNIEQDEQEDDDFQEESEESTELDPEEELSDEDSDEDKELEEGEEDEEIEEEEEEDEDEEVDEDEYYKEEGDEGDEDYGNIKKKAKLTQKTKKKILDEEGDEDEKGNCIYNYKSNNSDDEMEIVFDDDIDNETTLSSKIVPDNERITKPILFKYERVRLLGDRTQQLSLGAKPMLKNLDKNLSPKEIALLELEKNVMPLIIERPLPNGKKERWHIAELQH